MPFSILKDNPMAWGCPHLLMMVSSTKHGAELLIPHEAVQETARVPWNDHLSSRVHIRWRDDQGSVSHPVPLHLERLQLFRIAGIDKLRTARRVLRRLRADAMETHRHYWQFMVIATRLSTRQRRTIWREPFAFSDGASAAQAINDNVMSLFQEGGGLQLGEDVNLFILSADDQEGAPPTLDELGYAQSIYRFVHALTAAPNKRAHGRHLVSLVKLTSSPAVNALLFLYDPWEDDPEAWVVSP